MDADDRHKSLLQLHHQLSNSGHQIDVANLLQLLELQQLRQGDEFACYLNDEKVPRLMCVQFHPEKSQLYLQPVPPSNPSFMNNNNFNNSTDHNCHGSFSLDLASVQMVGMGKRVKEETKIRNVLQITQPISGDHCLSIYYGNWPWKELQLVARDPAVVGVWHLWLDKFIMHQRNTQNTTMSKLDQWLLAKYMELKTQQKGSVHAVFAVRSFTGFRLWKASRILNSLLKSDEELSLFVEQYLWELPFCIYQALYYSYIITERPDIQHLYNQNARSSLDGPPTIITDQCNSPKSISLRRRSSLKILNLRSRAEQRRNTIYSSCITSFTDMSINAFTNFLISFQGLSSLSTEEVKKIILNYDFQTINDQEVSYISLKGFAHYLLSQEPGSFSPLQDMTQPLSNYFIASSHNTYLTGHQLHGESSTSMYATVLQTGCRCVELDCWDGDDDDPIIYHGHTLTTKIKFEHVVQTIAKHAFVASPYPLVLSIENHCSIPQQAKMAAYMKREFGDLLLTDFIGDNRMPKQLPSPEDLKYKILVKNRKLSNSSPLATQQSQPSPVIINLSPQSPPYLSKSLFNSSPKITTPPSTSPITPTSATSCPTSANIFGFSFSNGTTEPQYISSEIIRQKPTPLRQNATSEESKIRQHSPLQQCYSLPSSPTLPYQPMSVIFEDENVKCGSLGRNVDQLHPITTKHSHNLHRSYSASQFELKTNQKSLLFDEQGDQLSSAKEGHSISLDTLGTKIISKKLQAADNNNEMNKEVMLPESFSNSRRGGVCRDGLQIEMSREEDKEEEQLPKLRGRRGGVIKETYQLQNDDPEEQDDKVLNNPRDPSNLEESPAHHIIHTENHESSQNQCRPTSIVIVSSDECDLASSLPESLLASALQEMNQLKSNSKKAIVSPTPSFSKHSEDLSFDSSSYSPPTSPHIVRQIRSTADNDSILPIHTSPSFNLGNPKSQGQFEQLYNQQDRLDVFKRFEPANNGRYFEDNVLDSDISQSLLSLILSSPIESSQDSLSLTNVTKPVHSLSNRGDMKQVSPLPVRKDIFNPSQSNDSLTSNSTSFIKKKNGSNGKSLKKSLNTGSSLKMLGHNLHRSSLALSQSSDPLPSSEYIDTMEASYRKNDIAQELSDLVLYTEAKKFPGFKDPKKVALKCTEMYSVAEPAAKKTVKKTPIELLEFTDNNLMRIYPAATRFNSSNFNPASFWMYGCQMVALNYQTSDQWMQYYSTFFQQNSGLGYVLKPPNLREWYDSSDTKQSLTTELKIMTISSQHYSQLPTFLPILEMEILGVPRDCCKLKTQCNTVTGNCGLWDPEKDNIFVANLTYPSFAAVKFALIVEKDSQALVQVVLTNDLRVGYQHVYFTENSLLSGHPPSSIFINVQKNVVGDSTKDSYWSHNSQAANDCNGDTGSSQLVIVPIYYNDLPNVDHDPVSLFADPTTTSNELLIGALAQLDSSINEACPQLQDREDEDELLRYFQFTLAQVKDTGEIRKICSLDHGRLIMPLFEWSSKKHCLLVTLKSNQEDNSVVIETATCDTNPVTVHRQSLSTGYSELVRRPSTVTLAETSLTKKNYLDIAELSLTSLSSAASKQRRISVDMKVEVNPKQRQKASVKSVISRTTLSSSHPLATVSYRKKNDPRHSYQRAYSVDYIQYKSRQQSSRQHQIEIETTEDSSQPPRSAIRKRSERSKLKQSVTFAAFPDIQQPSSGRIKLTKKFRKLFSQKQTQTSSSQQDDDDVFSGEDNTDNDDDFVTDYSDSSCSISGDNLDTVDPPLLNPVTKPSSLFRKKKRRHSAPVKRTDSYKHPRKKNSTGINIKRDSCTKI